MEGREIEAVGHNHIELFLMVSDTAALSAERERRTNNQRKCTKFFGRLASLGGCVNGLRFCYIKTDLDHRLLKFFAVFALLDRRGLGTDHLDAIPLQNSGVMKIH